MSDCLKLTAYFGERQRVGRQFLGDELLRRFAAHELASSIMLRGSAGFGLRHHLRTDQTLSMSEDPPAVAIGVDVRERVEPLLDEVAALAPRGVFTVERARLLRDLTDLGRSADVFHEEVKLTIYLGRHERVHRVPAFIAVCDLLRGRGVSGASVLLGVDGTLHGRRRRARFFDRNAEVPLMIVAVAPRKSIVAVLPELKALLVRPLITVERVSVCKRDGRLMSRPDPLPPADLHGRGIWQKLTVYTSESQLHDGEPIHRALVRRLRESTTARGATALRGTWGFHGDHTPHGDRLWQLGRRVPVTTVVVDSPDNIAASFDIVDELTQEHGLVTSEMVPAMLTLGTGEPRGGLVLARHPF
jgi:PII-like signaling protein